LERVSKARAERDALTARVALLESEVERMRAELSEHYPIAITARAMMNDEAKLRDLREISDAVLNATPGQRLQYLPIRLQSTRAGDDHE
jgi:hypothetical protein